MAQLTICRLGPADRAALSRLLQRDPVPTAYLHSEMRLNPAMPSWWGIGGAGELRAVFLGGPLVVPWMSDSSDAPHLAEAVHQQGPPRMIVGQASAVRSLATAISPRRQPLEARDPQPLLALDHVRAGPRGSVRRSRRGDLALVAHAAAAMHREEMGVDPMAIDAVGWRNRMATLIDRGWSYLWRDGREILFKAELSGWTPDTVQIQGVWTHPRWRGRGIATAGLTSLCSQLLREVSVCSLYVNSYNTAALRLYARLGFRQVGEFATLIY